MVGLGLAICVLTGGSTALAGTAGATAVGNRTLARKQAEWLLTLVPLPVGAVRLRSAPKSLSGPIMGTPAVTSLVDRYEAWQVAMPFARLQTWLREHRPRGRREVGRTTSWGLSGVTAVGQEYAGSTSPAWQSSDLEIGAAPAGQGRSVLRADGVVVWLDPRPLPDSARGPRLRVTIAHGCPGSDARYVGITNSGPGLKRRLLPHGRPTSGLECWYNGVNGRAFKLTRVMRLGAAAVSRMARSMARLPLSHPDGAVTVCPLGDDSTEVVALAYAGRPDVDLWVALTGCRYVANGFIMTRYY